MSEEEETEVEEQEHSEAEQAGNVDAMGRDKRRTVIGGQYGATVRKQLAVYGIFVAVVAVLVIGSLTVVSSIDNREMPLEDTAPWTQAGADQQLPRDVDFPANGPDNTIPADEIGKAVPPADANAETDTNAP